MVSINGANRRCRVIPAKSAPARFQNIFPRLACFLGLVLFIVGNNLLAQTAPPATYVRSFTNDIPNEPLVSVSVSGASNVFCLTIEETVPPAASVLSVSGDGVYLPALSAIRWGPYFKTPATNVSYRITGEPASYPVNGGSWMDGEWFFSPGITYVTVQSATTNVYPTQPSQVATPVFSPPDGAGVPVSVTISDATPDAAIYYTLNGSLPTQSSTPYSSPVPLSSVSVIRAAAFTNGWYPSAAAVAYYGEPTNNTIDVQVTRAVSGNPSASPMITFTVTPATNAGCEALTESISAGLTPVNVTSGGVYQPTNNEILWGPFLGTNIQTLSYQVTGQPGIYPLRASWSADGISSGEIIGTNVIITNSFSITNPVSPLQVATPTFIPPNGAGVPVSVTITDTTPDATIYYTLNGSLPTQSSTPYTSPLPLSSFSVVRAAAFTNGWYPSAAAVAYYGATTNSINVQVSRSVTGNSSASPMVTFTVTPATNASCVAVTESLSVGLTAINVSSGGAYLPTNNEILWGPFLNTNIQTLSYQVTGQPGIYPVRASWSADGVSSGEAFGTNLIIASSLTVTNPVQPSQVATPTLNPPSSSSFPLSVTISDTTPDAAIYYTLNGTLPTQSSTPYTGAIPLTSATAIRAAAFTNGWTPSTAAVGEYSPPLTTNIVAIVPTVGGNNTVLPVVTLTATPQGAVSCYAVVETIPYGATPTNLSGDGVWIPSVSSILWGPYLDNAQRMFTFGLNGASGTYTLTGQVSVNGFSMSTGTTNVQINTAVTGSGPQIITQPSNTFALVTSTVQFAVNASGTVPLTYQWYFNTNTPVQVPMTVSNLTLANVTATADGYYSVYITNSFGTATSSFASLTIVTPLVSNIVQNANGSMTLNFVGLPNASSRIWATTNLLVPADWLPIFTNSTTLPNGAWQYIDTNNTGIPRRFYEFSTP
jgi:Chitobiase/beta-hexosaminidase C-terminal domain/Immunoglobulin I-set domain